MKIEDIIIIEDNETMRLGMVESLRREGYHVKDYDNGTDALKALKIQPVSLVITDLKMEPLDGMEVLQQVKKIHAPTEVLLVSAYGSIDTAVDAMKIGAADFLTKPFSSEELRIRVKKIISTIKNHQELQNLIDQNRILHEELSLPYEEMVGSSPAMHEVFKLVQKVADKDSSVLIQGESGTGKELIARAIHRKSLRAEKPFIKINCGALNENLLESELFGHEKGAFTGAIKQKKGRFELANKGTLFLDEIGDISSTMQIKLLRVLQEGEFERVGGEETISTDVRIITATNRDLQKLMYEDKFREDLYYRLSVIPVNLPPLRDRKEDIPELAKHFLKKVAIKFHLPIKTINEQGMGLFYNYIWPGNIREFENLIERLFVICPGEEIESKIVAAHIGSIQQTTKEGITIPIDDALYAFEKNLLRQAMKEAGGIKNKAAKLLGLNTSTLYYKLEKFGL
jgi:two-component system response regulator HydG